MSFGTGPAVDHTTNSDAGMYMYAEASGQSAGDRAWMFSPVLEAAPQGACVSFWYHMYGIGMLVLGKVGISMYAKVGSQGGHLVVSSFTSHYHK